ncbi:hypothetical protein B0T25DRAFT_61510 [Lasiosphaeria hispida]|uniref:F-box domain-containing protein n=1 Tax=Lasiosphaeria hispida TaxID=260671 RepID=A0AAJ0HWT3_9PEZI|nr:hypothetical protein B0T25DRAFT_61510 [Lasiosphaeria hispida]
MTVMMITTLLGLQPNTAWTGRTAREGPHGSSATDPLVADTLYNATYSPLCRLPEEVLLRIMDLLDPIGLQCLRRTSRLFLRLFCDDRFDHYHDLTGLVNRGIYLPGPPIFSPWVRSRRVLECMYPRTPGVAPLHQLLQRDTASSICSACRENREARQAWNRTLRVSGASDTTSRHCVPCGLHHPLAYFSRIRRCIGRRGHVRLCEHQDCVITWDTVVRYGKQLARLDLPEPARIRLLVCRDKSHLPAHHHGRRADGDEAGYCPSITITGSKSTAIRLYMEWTGHVLLVPQGYPAGNPGGQERKKKERMTPTNMVRLLKRFRRDAPAEFIVPQSAPGCALPEMRCFDPNRCRCLQYVGQEDMPGGLPLARRQGGKGHIRCSNQACRFSSEGGGGGGNGDMAINIKTGTHTSRSVLGDGGDSETRIDIDPCTTATAVTTLVRGRPSPPSSCIEITYRRWILVAAEGEECRAVTQSWYEAVDPRSYAGVALGGDERTPFDVLACPRDDPACANYHRYSERPVMKGYGESLRVYDERCRPSRGRRDRSGDRLWGQKKTEKGKEEAPHPSRRGLFWVSAMVAYQSHNHTLLRVTFVIVLVDVLLRCFL